ncbi:uncharacterized protein (TIGR02679 family) [Sphaerisporangium rubeum]|uniref:Uncharacterized protein (TIGR02679 family) n=1 Tax=Sphaerisporangium rubeum TaxID=321317 RepID=A0A7X0M5U2_9ACTN|nr:uncharacterized protein (TIGR02679 family) [Sphaerisporangium rubeum]
MLGKSFSAGRIRVPLNELDLALRSSPAAAGLVTVVGQLTEGDLVDRVAARETARASWAGIWAALDAALSVAGVVDADWAPAFTEGVRRSGLLTRAGVEAATVAVAQFSAVLAECTASSALFAAADTTQSSWELAELAGRCAGDAHALDDGRLASSLMLRAAAAASGVPAPVSAEERRNLWARLGVTTDLLSSSVLSWYLRPPGPDPWSEMMRVRAGLKLVTHLSLYELRGAAKDKHLSVPGTHVFACENPQILQAAARTEVPVPLICFAGNPSVAALTTLRRLIDGGVTVHYHGDFDWPGVAITARLLTIGAKPWRMSADDYSNAVTTRPPDMVLPLTGTPAPTPWEPALADVMSRRNIAIHEETVLPTLLNDLRLHVTWSGESATRT